MSIITGSTGMTLVTGSLVEKTLVRVGFIDVKSGSTVALQNSRNEELPPLAYSLYAEIQRRNSTPTGSFFTEVLSKRM